MNKKHFAEMLGSLDEAVEIARGRMMPGSTYTLKEPDARAIRRTLGLTQTEFAALLDVPVATVQGYEQGRRAPDAPARTLLRVALAAPEVLRRLHAERTVEERASPGTVEEGTRRVRSSGRRR